MNIIEVDSCNDAYLEIGKKLINNPEYIVTPRDYKTYELHNMVILIKNPYNRLVKNVHRKLSLKYLVGEFLWYERASNKLQEISYYSKFWNMISDDGITSNSSYGKIIYEEKEKECSQWTFVKKELEKDKNSRRALMVISSFKPSHINTKDMPCTVGIQYMIRDNKLHMTVWMRSNDLYLGFCYDAAIFTIWQEKLLIELNRTYSDLTMGTYTHFATSMHIYEKNFLEVKKSIDSEYDNFGHELFNMPRIEKIGTITEVQKLEKNIRENNIDEIDEIDDDFGKWLVKCLNYEY
ncbi:MAG TPA: hypothetical protein EYG89_03425 [Bacteroidia bacterium]|nr:hypothetical protein [Bacteroidia bacterium]